MRAPRYAQVTGKRILFESFPFHRGDASPFTASERKFNIEFPYAWKESDAVTIKLPNGWTIDRPESPGSLSFGAGTYNVKMAIGKENQFTVSRELTFGTEGALYFEAKNYAALKKVFDELQLRDRHTLTLKGSE